VRKTRPIPRDCYKCGCTFRPALNADDRRLCRACQFKGSKDVDLAIYEEAFQKGIALGRAELPVSVMDLIQLCHPDRHPPERRDLANAVTMQLNEMPR
jgi:hypothetical protein